MSCIVEFSCSVLFVRLSVLVLTLVLTALLAWVMGGCLFIVVGYW